MQRIRFALSLLKRIGFAFSVLLGASFATIFNSLDDAQGSLQYDCHHDGTCTVTQIMGGGRYENGTYCWKMIGDGYCHIDCHEGHCWGGECLITNQSCGVSIDEPSNGCARQDSSFNWTSYFYERCQGNRYYICRSNTTIRYCLDECDCQTEQQCTQYVVPDNCRRYQCIGFRTIPTIPCKKCRNRLDYCSSPPADENYVPTFGDTLCFKLYAGGGSDTLNIILRASTFEGAAMNVGVPVGFDNSSDAVPVVSDWTLVEQWYEYDRKCYWLRRVLHAPSGPNDASAKLQIAVLDYAAEINFSLFCNNDTTGGSLLDVQIPDSLAFRTQHIRF